MTNLNSAFAAAAIVLAVTGPGLAETPRQAVYKAHDAYLAAINSNSLQMFLGTVTDDIVFIAPNAPVMEGKAQVGAWVGGYFEAVETSWEKTPVEFVVADDWAFERYVYKAVDTPRGGGDAYTDTGSGINIYRLEHDGVWRVARDAWATSPGLAGAMDVSAWASCSGTGAPC